MLKKTQILYPGSIEISYILVKFFKKLYILF